MSTTMQIRDAMATVIGQSEYEGPFGQYVWGEEDVEAVIAILGYRPSREQWADAGIKWVGDKHLASEGR